MLGQQRVDRRCRVVMSSSFPAMPPLFAERKATPGLRSHTESGVANDS